ncbi:MAG: hypothetical protein HY720_15375, partial [Planctomycetes bacterium]|nr:hypothetical protein [Planctomycetota bacterium]
MAFEWDHLHERLWLSWLRGQEERIETKRRVAGGAMHVDIVLWGPLDRPPLEFFDFVPGGLTGVENKAPGTMVRVPDVFRLAGKLGLLLEREAIESRRPIEPDRSSIVLVGAALSHDLLRAGGVDLATLRPGVRRVARFHPAIFLVSADDLPPTVKNAPWIVYYGSDEAVERLVRELDPVAYGDLLSRAFVHRRFVLRRALKQRGIDMSEIKLDLKGAIEEIGVKRVIEEVGLKEVIEEVGLKEV